jgi:molecular chaperone Hsp33
MSHGAEPDSLVRRFLFEDLEIRGALVRLRGAWRSMQQGRGYPAPVARLLGELTAVTALIGCNLKQPGRLTVQVQGHGPVSLLVIDCSAALKIRGMARHAEAIEDAPVPALLGDGKLAITLQSDHAPRPYQSIVPLDGESVAAIFEHFLEQSEQQPALLWLSADAQAAAGLFLQRLPEADARDPDGWSRITLLAGTVRPEELRDLPATALLTRLFPEETLRVFQPRAVDYDCPENWRKVHDMLRSLGREELDSVLQERGEIVVHDDICNHTYRLDRAAVEALFDAGGEPPPAKR